MYRLLALAPEQRSNDTNEEYRRYSFSGRNYQNRTLHAKHAFRYRRSCGSDRLLHKIAHIKTASGPLKTRSPALPKLTK
jgi:hypothetical protein